MSRLLTAVWLAVTPASTAAAADQVFDFTIVHGRLSGSPDTIRVHQDDNVVLRWHSDGPIVLHLHGYEIETRLVPNRVAETRFEARASGRFPIHVHAGGARSEAVLVYVEVYPE